MKTMTGITLFVGLTAGLLFISAQQAPQAGRGGRGGRPARRKVVLAWADTRNGIAQHESVSHALAVIERLGYESGAYDTFIRTDSNIIANEPNMTTGPPATGGSSPPPLPGTFFLWRPGDAPRAQPSNRLGQW